METIIYILLLAVVMLNFGFFLGQWDVKNLKKENKFLRNEANGINKLYRKTALEMQNSEGRNRRLRNQIANYHPQKVAEEVEKHPEPIIINFGTN